MFLSFRFVVTNYCVEGIVRWKIALDKEFIHRPLYATRISGLQRSVRWLFDILDRFQSLFLRRNYLMAEHSSSCCENVLGISTFVWMYERLIKDFAKQNETNERNSLFFCLCCKQLQFMWMLFWTFEEVKLIRSCQNMVGTVLFFFFSGEHHTRYYFGKRKCMRKTLCSII